LLASPTLMTDPAVLNQVGAWASYVTSTTGSCTRELWLGETGGAVGGGAENVSDVFAGSFEFLDKLGVVANAGHTLVFRQTLCGYRYGLISFALTPNPDFWTFLLFKRLVGEAVLTTRVSGANATDRVYAFCSREHVGGVVLLFLNLANITASSMSFGESLGGGDFQLYLFTSGDGTLTSPSVRLNGAVLALGSDGGVPTLPPVVASSGVPLVVPPSSFGFAVFQDARAPACS
jgi:hypothetical protein